MGKSIGLKPKKSSFIPEGNITDNAFGKYEIEENIKNIKAAINSYSIGKSPRKMW